MSRPAPLYLSEAEIAQRVGLSALDWQAVATVLEKSGLPKPDPLFKNRRYWPAVSQFLDRRNSPSQYAVSALRDGEENWQEDRNGRRARA